MKRNYGGNGGDGWQGRGDDEGRAEKVERIFRRLVACLGIRKAPTSDRTKEDSDAPFRLSMPERSRPPGGEND